MYTHKDVKFILIFFSDETYLVSCGAHNFISYIQ